MNNLINVNNIFVNDANGTYECLATISNYSDHKKWMSVGESILSNPFSLIFPNSIGESQWQLMLFPKGQYVNTNKPGTSVGIYLVMLSCENKTETLTGNITFKLKSITGNDRDSNMNAEFIPSIPSKRWIGKSDFVKKKWLNSKRGQHVLPNDTLTIICLFEETYPKEEPKETSPNKNSIKIESQTDVKADALTFYDDIQKNNGANWCSVNYGRGKRTRVVNQNNVNPSIRNSSVYAITLLIFSFHN